jgi:hypothetical protein
VRPVDEIEYQLQLIRFPEFRVSCCSGQLYFWASAAANVSAKTPPAFG